MMNEGICWFHMEESLDELPLCVYSNEHDSNKTPSCLCLSRGKDEDGVHLTCMRKGEEDLLWHLKTIRYSSTLKKGAELECPLSDLGDQNISQIIEHNIYVHENLDNFTKLTTREKEVLGKIALGFKNKEIAELLKISEATVKQHRKLIKRKLGMKSTPELVYFVQAFGL